MERERVTSFSTTYATITKTDSLERAIKHPLPEESPVIGSANGTTNEE